MDLEWALYELTKQPQSVICKDGHAHPALRYTTRTRDAINWLLARYEDGTLKVEGYVPKHGLSKKEPPTRERDIDNGYMYLSEFIRRSGFSRKETLRIARKADAYIQQLHKGSHSFINVRKFYDYLNLEQKRKRENSKINLRDACELSGLDKKTMKALIADGTIRAIVRRSNNGRTEYEIFETSVIRYMKKGESNGKDNTDDGEVCGE